MSLLEVDDLTVTYAGAGAPSVRDLSLRVEPGETLGLVGESGCGKSTTVHALLRLLPAGTSVAGRVRFQDRDLLGLPRRDLRGIRWRDVALVPQSAMNSLDPVRTVESQFVEVIRIHRRCSRKHARGLARDALAEVGIDPARGSSYPHQFSGGMRQRAMIAMATILQPSLLIADEPTTGLDVVVQDQVLGALETVQRRHGLAVVLVTHDLGVVAELCDRIVVMREGRMVETGTVEDVILRPRDEYTARLIAAVEHRDNDHDRAGALVPADGRRTGR
ncbi:ABC transporter ATP-binding protein [Jiangella alba]|uniref:Peptide/nickel transport system ATP-binding protein n=1 Tax=Jiangella alba TaxID=561176 RepID=A0A1H5PYW3_9ACTN|nr:ABC transporter ATP-binding protein [Jiangella alba]SEF18889.1 peptide/nickel transport system ATP-binding protein [Jiangella alba]